MLFFYGWMTVMRNSLTLLSSVVLKCVHQYQCTLVTLTKNPYDSYNQQNDSRIDYDSIIRITVDGCCCGGRAVQGWYQGYRCVNRFPDYFQYEVFLPRNDDNEVHDVPQVPHITVLVQNESQGQDFGTHFDGEDYHKDGFQVFLQKSKQAPLLVKVVSLSAQLLQLD